jgi:hypothetical protein
MRLYLDDCVDDRLLIRMLRDHGHDVLSPREEGTSGQSDLLHLQDAARQSRVLLTKDTDDFEDLREEWHEAGRVHAGMILVFEEHLRSKNMTPAQVLTAIGRLEGSGIPLENDAHVLNHWRGAP